MPVTPEQLRAYSSFKQVIKRSDEHLKNDIEEAYLDVRTYVGHNFEEYETIPTDALTAVKKLAQYYALINSDESIAKGVKQERFENYSRTIEVNGKPDVSSFLNKYVKKEPKKVLSNGVRLRAL